MNHYNFSKTTQPELEAADYLPWHTYLDELLATTTPCPRCGAPQRRFVGFSKDSSRRAFAVCPNCDLAQEF